MRALVTGGHGFVGAHLRAHCEQCGDEVVSLDRTGEEPLDVTDRDAVRDAFARHRPEVVYHLAALSHVGESWDDPTAVLRVNVEGTAHVLGAAHAVGAGRVVVIGSGEEYGKVEPDEVPVGEDVPLRPTSPYGVSKLAASYLALQAHLAYGLDVVRVRAFSHTGPGQSPKFLVPALAARIVAAEREGRDEICVGSLDPVRDFTDVRDVVRAYRLLATGGEAGAVYNVCSGTGVAVRDVAARLVAMATRPLSVSVDPELVRAVDVPCMVGDPGRLRARTGWSPEYSLEETLTAVLEDARARD